MRVHRRRWHCGHALAGGGWSGWCGAQGPQSVGNAEGAEGSQRAGLQWGGVRPWGQGREGVVLEVFLRVQQVLRDCCEAARVEDMWIGMHELC